ncbi:MAG TPA: hypothetical protein ENN57_01730 [Chloroflexi bacterium]|nr:hypothetical protein [Chloroflexota bacterium]
MPPYGVCPSVIARSPDKSGRRSNLGREAMKLPHPFQVLIMIRSKVPRFYRGNYKNREVKGSQNAQNEHETKIKQPLIMTELGKGLLNKILKQGAQQ